MRRARAVCLLPLLAACIGGDTIPLSQSSDAAGPPPIITVTRDVVYDTARVLAGRSRNKALMLDIYQPPATSDPHPAFIAIHGGGLRRGDKGDENMAQLCEVLASRGFVCLSINYRMVANRPADERDEPMDVLRAATTDAARAAIWLRDNAGAYRVDTSRIAIGGSSSGATLALQIAYGPANPKMRFASVFSWSGDPYGSAPLIGKGEPPLFIAHGVADTSVTPAKALELAARAKEVGVPFELHLCEELAHSVPLDRKPGGKMLYDYLVAFLNAKSDTTWTPRTSTEPESCPR